MNRTRLALLVLIPAWLGAAGLPARAAQLVALAPEEELFADIFVNVPAVAAQPGGPYVIAWDDDSFSPTEGILFYRYTAAGRDIGNGVDRGIESPTGVPSVDAVTAGRQGFDVLWHTESYEEEPTLFYRAHLNLQGKPEGKPIRLGGAGTEWVWQVKGNGFMAGWSSQQGIAVRRLTSTGQRTGSEMRLNSRPVDRLAGVSVVGLADGGFVAVWRGSIPGSRPRTAVLRARRFSPSGKPLGADFDVNTIPLGRPNTSDDGPGFKVAAAPGGGFAVSWALSKEVYLRWFNASGIAPGPERKATTSAGYYAALPESMAFDDTGNLLLLFSVDYENLQLRLFDPLGMPQGPPVAVTSDDETRPWGGSLAWTGDSWLVAWVAAIFPYDQGDIFARRFAKR